MLDALTAIARLFPDPIKDLNDLAAISRHGWGHEFRWLANAGWTGGDVELLLRDHGVYVYKRRYATPNGGDYGIMVRKKQAKYAQYLLESHDVPLTGGYIGPRHPHWAKPRSNWGRGRPADFMGHLSEWFYRGHHRR